jgi:hypothetical protein
MGVNIATGVFFLGTLFLGYQLYQLLMEMKIEIPKDMATAMVAKDAVWVHKDYYKFTTYLLATSLCFVITIMTMIAFSGTPPPQE